MRILVFVLFIKFNLSAQSSFLKELSTEPFPSIGFILQSKISVFNNDFSILAPHFEGFDIYDFPNSKVPRGFRISPDSMNTSSPSIYYDRFSDFHLASFQATDGLTSYEAVCVLNFEDRINWCRKTSEILNGLSSYSVFSTDSSIYSQIDISKISNSEEKLAISKMHLITGDWQWGYTYCKNPENQSTLYLLTSIKEFPNNDISIGFIANGTTNIGQSESGIIKVSSEGKYLDNIILKDSIRLNMTDQGMDSFGNMYFCGSIQNPLGSKNELDGFVAKISQNLELIWAKRLYADNFEYNRLNITTFPDGTTFFTYSTLGDLPVISGSIDLNGNLLGTNGYSFFSPEIEIDLEGSLYAISDKKYFEEGNSVFATMISKTDANGSIDGCPQFDACLTLFDLDIPLAKWNWIQDTIEPLSYIDFGIDTIDFTLTDHCGTPRPPNPYFDTPDTICQNQCLRPDSLYNHLAHAVEWRITGNDILFESQDTSFNYCFNEPGKYQIEQEIWLLGCSEFFTREVVVLPDSLGDLLGDDQLICDDTIAVLEPNAIRPLREYSWSDSTRDSSLTVSESGIYVVEVSDGYCSASDEVEIRFFDELFSGIDLELPTDTNICQELLPFTLTPKSDFSNEFFINGSTNPQSTFEIQTAGNYQISTKIEDCEITKNFNLSLTPCEVDIYIPSSFSPNNDGINDLLEPLGNDFMGQQLQVFDRWGGLLFETKEAPFAWDGSEVGSGVYVVTFSYLNLKNQREEMVSGDVLVVR